MQKNIPTSLPRLSVAERDKVFKVIFFSFAKMAQGIFDKAKLRTLPEVLNRGLNIDPDSRPQLQQILEALT